MTSMVSCHRYALSTWRTFYATAQMKNSNEIQKVFAVLARLGRLPLPAIVQHTGLHHQHIRHGLAVLIQQNLAFHYTDPDTLVAFYEANLENAYALVRSGKIIEFVIERHGRLAGGVIQNLLLLGHAKIEDLSNAYGVGYSQQGTTTNG